MTKKELFLKLFDVDVEDRLDYDSFSGLYYLNWAKCHELMTKNTESYNYEYIKNPVGGFIFLENGSPYVAVKVIADGVEEIENLPIMEGKANSSVDLKEVTARDVNDALKRCYVKTCALLGLGLKVNQGLYNNKNKGKTAPKPQEAPKKQKDEPKTTEEKKAPQNAVENKTEQEMMDDFKIFEQWSTEERNLSTSETAWLKGFINRIKNPEKEFSDLEKKYIRQQIPKKAKPAEKVESKEVLNNNTPKCTDDFGI